jgi:hypothetical protein
MVAFYRSGLGRAITYFRYSVLYLARQFIHAGLRHSVTALINHIQLAVWIVRHLRRNGMGSWLGRGSVEPATHFSL